MQQPNTSFNWIVPLVVVLIIVGTLLGLTMSNTNLFNFNTSAADMRAKDQATAAEAAKVEIDQQIYAAQKQNEIAAIEANARAQADKAWIDRQMYRVQQMAEGLKQVAAAKQLEAQQLTQVEVERQNLLTQAEVERQGRLTQVEIQREQQLAQIRASDRQQAEQAIRTITLTTVLTVITAAIALGGLGLGFVVLSSRLQQVRQASAVTAIDTELAPQPVLGFLANQRTDREYWLRKRIEARANEIASRGRQLPGHPSPGSTVPRYHDLPLAE